MKMEPIAFADFAKVEMRIGEIVAAEIPEGSEKVIRMTVDFGEAQGGKRTIFAGIKQWYQPEKLVGMRLPFILNIPAKKMGEMGESQGMLLAVMTTTEEGGERPALLVPEAGVKPGDGLR
jgi:methionyl-tRNA synthetase